MPLLRRRASVLGHSSADRPVPAGTCGGRVTVSSCVTPPRSVLVGSGMGTRVTRRALGISSVFLQGTRSCTAPVIPKTGLGQSGLGWSLVDYRDKVQALEQLNQQLEDQIRICLDRRTHSASAWGPLKTEWEQVYRQVSESILSNARLMLQTENVQANAEDFKERFESERPFRKALEEEISSLYKVIDDANETRLELQQQMDNMWAELRSLQHSHQQDVRGLFSQMCGQDLDEPDSNLETGLDQILDRIRAHWEQVCEQTRAQTDCTLESKEQVLSTGLSPEQEQVESLKAEVQETSCKLQSLQAQTESIRALKRGLEASLSDARHWQEVELQNLGSVVSRLEAELNEVRTETEQQRRDYDTLLNNKHRLEQEIALYHGLLDTDQTQAQTRQTQAQTQVQTESGSAPAPTNTSPKIS